MIAQCVSCQGRFTAKRAHAKYCSERCRKRVQRGSSQPPLPPGRQAGAPLIVLPSAPSSEDGDGDGFAAETRRELEAAGRLDGYLGRAALRVAQIIDSNPSDTGGGHAALIKEYVARMSAALEGVVPAETPLERQRRAREMKVG